MTQHEFEQTVGDSEGDGRQVGRHEQGVKDSKIWHTYKTRGGVDPEPEAWSLLKLIEPLCKYCQKAPDHN